MNPQNGQTSLDYLNQIAPQAPKRAGFALNLRTILLGAAVVLVLIIIIASVSGAITGARKEPWQRFAAKLNNTTKIVDSSSSLIKNSQLRSLNSDLKLYITNTQRDLADPLTALQIDSAKLPSSVLTLENNDKVTARLEDGRLNAKYDSTYAREMSYQLATLLALIKQLQSSGVSAKTKAFLASAYDNLKPTYTSISEFSASNE